MKIKMKKTLIGAIGNGEVTITCPNTATSNVTITDLTHSLN